MDKLFMLFFGTLLIDKGAWMREEGVEPSCLSAPDPKSGAYASSATLAYGPSRNRTYNQRIKSPLLYQLSYRPIAPGAIRTPDRRIRNPLLYPAELQTLKQNSVSSILGIMHNLESTSSKKR